MAAQPEVVTADNVHEFASRRREQLDSKLGSDNVQTILNAVANQMREDDLRISRGLANHWLRKLEKVRVRNEDGRELTGQQASQQIQAQALKVVLSMTNTSYGQLLNMTANSAIKSAAECPKPWSCTK